MIFFNSKIRLTTTLFILNFFKQTNKPVTVIVIKWMYKWAKISILIVMIMILITWQYRVQKSEITIYEILL